MKSSKIFLTAGLLVAAIAGAFAAKTTVTETLFWKNGASYQPIQTEVICPQPGIGCTDVVPGHGPQQLYRFDGVNYISLKPQA